MTIVSINRYNISLENNENKYCIIINYTTIIISNLLSTVRSTLRKNRFL